jgi:hypothetical protein
VQGARGANRQGTSACLSLGFGGIIPEFPTGLRGSLWERRMAWAARATSSEINHLLAPDGPPNRLREVAIALSVSTFCRLFPEAGNRGRCRCGGETVARTSCPRSGAVRAAAASDGWRRSGREDRGRARDYLYSGLNTISVWHAYCAGARGIVSLIGYRIWWCWVLRAQELCEPCLAASSGASTVAHIMRTSFRPTINPRGPSGARGRPRIIA